MNKLLPCPFCGGEARIQCAGVCMKHDGQSTDYFVSCHDCNASTQRYFETEQEAIAAWNLRAAPENPPLTLDELRELDFEKLWIIPFGEKADKAYCYLHEPQYAILRHNAGFEDDLISLECKNGDGVTWRLSEYSKAWLAYAHEYTPKKQAEVK